MIFPNYVYTPILIYIQFHQSAYLLKIILNVKDTEESISMEVSAGFLKYMESITKYCSWV